jgi:uncharacterized membrane protein
LAKTIVYRIWAIALLGAVSYYFTGNAGEATTITILFNLGGTIAYYGLERLWESIRWGRIPPSPVATSFQPQMPDLGHPDRSPAVKAALPNPEKS